jgi:hypothetical protein
MSRKGLAKAGLLMLLLAACSLALPLSSQIVGTWRMDTNPNFTITFSANGTVSNSFGAYGTWSLTGDKLTLQWSGQSANIITIAIDGDKLTMTFGFTTTYTRIK